MINEQVQNYFRGQKLYQLYQLVQEAYINLSQMEPPHIHLIAEGVGDDIKLYIDKDDLRWVHYVRIQFMKQHPGDTEALPKPYRILATRYALLHPLPLHDYSAKWDDAGSLLKIYESRRVGGGNKFEPHHVADVNDEMRKLYTLATKKKAEPGQAGDEEVARWWMEENKNCLHDYLRGKKNEGKPPSAQVKILRRGPTSVDLAFRRPSRGKFATYAWHTVTNIGINIAKFRKKAESQGFNEKMHAGAILRYSTWEKILEPEKVGDGGKTDNERLDPAEKRASHMGLRMPKKHIDHRGYIVPGKKEKEYNPSEEFLKQYNKDPEFQKYIEEAVIKATASSISFLTKGDLRVRIEYSADTNHKINIPPLYRTKGMTRETVQNILQETRQRLIARTGRVSDNDWSNWKELFQQGEEKDGLRGWIYRVTVSSARSAASAEFGMSLKGGAGSIIAQGSGDPSGGKGDSYQDGGSEELSAFSGAAKGNVPRAAAQDAPTQAINTEKQKEMQQAILGALKNPQLLRSQPQLVTRIKALAATDPMIAQLLDNMGINLDDLQQQAQAGGGAGGDDDDDDAPDYGDYGSDVDDEDDEDYGSGSFGKYSRQGVRREGFSPYSFRNYLATRMNETGVVWGNDKDSSKKLKPGQTLKGGIQVSGAPWTAGGGPNYSGNDVKVKG